MAVLERTSYEKDMDNNTVADLNMHCPMVKCRQTKTIAVII